MTPIRLNPRDFSSLLDRWGSSLRVVDLPTPHAHLLAIQHCEGEAVFVADPNVEARQR